MQDERSERNEDNNSRLDCCLDLEGNFVCFVNQAAPWLVANNAISQWWKDDVRCFILNEMCGLAGSQNASSSLMQTVGKKTSTVMKQIYISTSLNTTFICNTLGNAQGRLCLQRRPTRSEHVKCYIFI